MPHRRLIWVQIWECLNEANLNSRVSHGSVMHVTVPAEAISLIWTGPVSEWNCLQQLLEVRKPVIAMLSVMVRVGVIMTIKKLQGFTGMRRIRA